MRRYYELMVLPLAILAIWAIVTGLNLLSPLFLPSPWAVGGALVQLTTTGQLPADVGATFGRAAVGFVLAGLVGIPVGVAMGLSARVYRLFEVAVEFIRAIPYTALFPLFLLFFGVGSAVKFAVCAWSAWLLVVVNTMYGVHHRSGRRLLVAQLLRASPSQRLFRVILPEAAPHIAAGLRLALSVTVQAAVVVEMFMGTTSVGLGKLIYESAMVARTAEMYAGILVAGAIGYLANRLFMSAEHRIIHWTDK